MRAPLHACGAAGGAARAVPLHALGYSRQSEEPTRSSMRSHYGIACYGAADLVRRAATSVPSLGQVAEIRRWTEVWVLCIRCYIGRLPDLPPRVDELLSPEEAAELRAAGKARHFALQRLRALVVEARRGLSTAEVRQRCRTARMRAGATAGLQGPRVLLRSPPLHGFLGCRRCLPCRRWICRSSCPGPTWAQPLVRQSGTQPPVGAAFHQHRACGVLAGERPARRGSNTSCGPEYGR